MKNILSSFFAIGVALTMSCPAHALSSCFYQHVGVASGDPYIPGSNVGSYMGDTHTILSNPNGSIGATWSDPVLNLKYSIQALDSVAGGYCSFQTNVSDSGRELSFTTVNIHSACGNSAEFETVVEFPDSTIEAQLKNRIGNQGPVYTGVELACFGN